MQQGIDPLHETKAVAVDARSRACHGGVTTACRRRGPGAGPGTAPAPARERGSSGSRSRRRFRPGPCYQSEGGVLAKARQGGQSPNRRPWEDAFGRRRRTLEDAFVRRRQESGQSPNRRPWRTPLGGGGAAAVSDPGSGPSPNRGRFKVVPSPNWRR